MTADGRMALRKEEEVFADLAELCTSDGYVHAIAYLSFRDNFVPYSSELTTKDLEPLFSPKRLIRTEIATLIGLLVRQPISYVLPSPGTLQHYIERTEALLEELHRVLIEPRI